MSGLGDTRPLTTVSRVHDAYVPAAGRHGLTSLYDPIVAVTMRERTFRCRDRLRTGWGTLELLSAERAEH
jgi:hypothetical protein